MKPNVTYRTEKAHASTYHQVLNVVGVFPQRRLHRTLCRLAQLGKSAMSTSRQERQHAVAPLANRVEGSVDALQIAAVLAGFCQEIDAALTPILGPRGVSALHVRSLHVCSRRHGWVLGPGGIAGMSGGAPHASAVDTLLAWLAMRSPSEALESGDAYLQTFHDLLVTLIGSSLTERLLRTVWPSISSGTPAQDTPQ